MRWVSEIRIKEWLQIGRAQTFPADWLLVIVPFLHGRFDFFQALVLSILMWFSHILSFGHNSLLDASCKPSIDSPYTYDQLDPSKSHHPLIRGAISLYMAKNVILWGLGFLAVGFICFTFLIAENLSLSLTFLFLYWVWGVLYNEGLSKESPLGFLSISLCFTSMSAFAWFLSHETLATPGLLYVLYSFFTILFQISFSGFLKELSMRERSNILTRMGAKIDVTWKGEKVFKPRKAIYYGVAVKVANLSVGFLLLMAQFNISRLAWYLVVAGLALFFLYKLVKPRVYIRGKELLSMSLEEIATIYIIPILMLDVMTAGVLMVIGVLYFFGINLWLWEKPFPRV